MDKKETSTFQLIFMGIFGAIIFIGFIALLTTNGGSGRVGPSSVATILIWGTYPGETIDRLKAAMLEQDKNAALNFNYVEKRPETFATELAEALSQQTGPDVILIPQDMMLRQKSKIYQIPFGQNTITAGAYYGTFLNAAQVFLDHTGAWALPFAIDPLIAYWNRQHFTNEGLVVFPATWDNFDIAVQKLTKKDANLTLLRNGVGMGTWDNVNNAKNIINTLFLQQGTKLVVLNRDNYFEVISGVNDAVINNTLSYYTNFANPTKPEYSWNRTMGNDLQYFTSGRSSIYFGLASELPNVSQTNPNLNFFVATVPQQRDAEIKSTFANVYGFALMKLSPNLSDSFRQITVLTSAEAVKILTGLSNLPPIRRDVAQDAPDQNYMEIFYQSAVISDTWPDPDNIATDAAYKSAIDQILLTNNPAGAMRYLLDNFSALLNSLSK